MNSKFCSQIVLCNLICNTFTTKIENVYNLRKNAMLNFKAGLSIIRPHLNRIAVYLTNVCKAFLIITF